MSLKRRKMKGPCPLTSSSSSTSSSCQTARQTRQTRQIKIPSRSLVLVAVLAVVLASCFHVTVSNSLAFGSSRNRNGIRIRHGSNTLIDVDKSRVRLYSSYRDNKGQLPLALTPPSSQSSSSSSIAKQDLSLQSQLQEKIKIIKEADGNDNNINSNDDDDNEQVKSEIDTIIQQMEHNAIVNVNTSDGKVDDNDFSPSSLQRFKPAFGLYNVTYVVTKNKDENPVGGKWTRKRSRKNKGSSTSSTKKQQGDRPKLFSIRRTMQHLLPVNSTTLGQLYIDMDSMSKSKAGVASTSTSASTSTDTTANKDDAQQRRPVVAECINVITIDALWNMIRLSIILRGDAVPLTIQERQSKEMKGPLPLTNLAVKAFFDSPRIVLSVLLMGILGGKSKSKTTSSSPSSSSTQSSTTTRRLFNLCNLSIGPKSSVILDTTYIDNNVRIGKGGTSGTRFIFNRCFQNDVEANDFQRLLLMKSTGKSKLLSILVAIVIGAIAMSVSFAGAGTGASAALSNGAGSSGFGSIGSLLGKLIGSGSSSKVAIVGKIIALSASLLFGAVLFSTGGIEQDQNQEEETTA